jgi:polar amino acid transport system substrate-binding protein
MPTRTTLLLALAAATVVTLAACSSPSDTPAGGATGSAVPSTDVVAPVKTDPTLAADLPASIRSARSISFGTSLNPGTSGLPYSGQVGGKYVGLHNDLADAVAKVLGVSAKLVNGTFPTIVPGVQNGKFDVGLDNFGVTAEREKVVDYATYLTDGQSFLGSKSVKLTKVTKLTDLCGLTIATSPGSTFQQILESGKSDCTKAGKKAYTVQYFSTSAPILLGLSNGKVDVEFGPTLSVKYDAAHIAGTTFLGQISSTPVGFLTAKGSPLAKSLQGAVNDLIKSGDYTKILAKWGVTASAISTSEVNPKATL